MTTETLTSRRRATGAPGPAIVAGCAVVTAAAGLVAVLAAALLGGSGVAGAVALGAGLVVAVFAFGTLSLHVVAQVVPAATLLVALVTYAAQAALLLVVLVAVARSATFSADHLRTGLAVGIVVATLAWTAAQVVLTARRRIPLYDLPDRPGPGQGPRHGPGGER